MSAPIQNRTTDAIELQLSKGSASGERTSAALNVSEFLYFLLLIPALFIAMMPLGIYPPLDTRLPLGFIICAFLLSAVPRLVSFVQRKQGGTLGLWRGVATCSGLSLPLIGLLLFLNGRLDKSPRTEVRATVIQKIAPVGYREAQYTLIVDSWRPGKSLQDLNVGSRVFERAVVGRSVTVELRNGVLGIPWVESISPD